MAKSGFNTWREAVIAQYTKLQRYPTEITEVMTLDGEVFTVKLDKGNLGMDARSLKNHFTAHKEEFAVVLEFLTARVGAYVEAGVGVHLLAKTSLGDKRYSTAFQFGSHLGGGYRFGARHAFDLGYSFQHISNANIKLPNDGANFQEVRLQYHF